MSNEEQVNENMNQEKLEELKVIATELGLSFRENIGIAKLEEKIAQREEELAKEKREEKIKSQKESAKKVKVVIEPRHRDEGIDSQFFGYNSMSENVSENILIKFGEEVEISERMYEYIKSITFLEKKFKMEPDENGIPRKVWYDKKNTRFIVSKV